MDKVPQFDIGDIRKLTRTEWNQQVKEIQAKIQAETPPFVDDSDEAKEARRARGSRDFFWWGMTYCPHYFTAKPAPMHRKVVGLLDKPGVYAINWPRGFAKTTLITQLYALWRALYKRSRFIVIIGKSREDAANLLRPVQMECEANGRLRQDFGDLKGSSWGENDFTLKTGPRFVGIGRKVRGLKHLQYRPDFVVPDDIEDEELASNPKRVKKLLQWFLGSVLPMVDKKGVVVWVGTLLAKKSALALMLDPEADLTGEGVPIEATRVKFSAIDDKGRSTWPEMWPISILNLRRRQMGSMAFNREYLGQVSDEESMFQREWFRDYDKRPESLVAGIYIDPSLGNNPKSCHQATLAIGLERETMEYFTLHARLRRESIEEMLNRGLDLWEEIEQAYGNVVIGFESNGFQVLLKNDFERLCRERGIRPPIVMIDHRQKKDIRVQSIVPIAEAGHIFVQRGQSDQNVLLDQFEFYGSGIEKDGPDAFEGGISMLKGTGLVCGGYESAGQRTGMRGNLGDDERGRNHWHRW